jgi:hypothetical protein
MGNVWETSKKQCSVVIRDAMDGKVLQFFAFKRRIVLVDSFTKLLICPELTDLSREYPG